MFTDTSGLKTTLMVFFRLNTGINLMLVNHFPYQVIFATEKQIISLVFHNDCIRLHFCKIQSEKPPQIFTKCAFLQTTINSQVYEHDYLLALKTPSLTILLLIIFFRV